VRVGGTGVCVGAERHAPPLPARACPTATTRDCPTRTGCSGSVEETRGSCGPPRAREVLPPATRVRACRPIPHAPAQTCGPVPNACTTLWADPPLVSRPGDRSPKRVQTCGTSLLCACRPVYRPSTRQQTCDPIPAPSQAPPKASVLQAPGVCALLTSYTPATFRIARIRDGSRAASGSWTV